MLLNSWFSIRVWEDTDKQTKICHWAPFLFWAAILDLLVVVVSCLLRFCFSRICLQLSLKDFFFFPFSLQLLYCLGRWVVFFFGGAGLFCWEQKMGTGEFFRSSFRQRLWWVHSSLSCLLFFFLLLSLSTHTHIDSLFPMIFSWWVLFWVFWVPSILVYGSYFSFPGVKKFFLLLSSWNGWEMMKSQPPSAKKWFWCISVSFSLLVTSGFFSPLAHQEMYVRFLLQHPRVPNRGSQLVCLLFVGGVGVEAHLLLALQALAIGI